MKAVAALLACLLGLSGCRYAEESHGDRAFVEREPTAELVPGKTTPLEVARALGPPGAVWTRGQELWFVYRTEEVRDRSLVLRYFGGRWLQGNMARRVDRTLLLVFDARDQLLLRAATSGE